MAKVVSALRHKALMGNKEGGRGVLVAFDHDASGRLYALAHEDGTKHVPRLFSFFAAFRCTLLGVGRQYGCAFVVFFEDRRFRILFFKSLRIRAGPIDVAPNFIRRFPTNSQGAFRVGVPIGTIRFARVFHRACRALRYVVKVSRRAKARGRPFGMVSAVGLGHRICRFKREWHDPKRIVASPIGAVNAVMCTVVNGRRFRWQGTASIFHGAVTGAPSARHVAWYAKLINARHTA